MLTNSTALFIISCLILVGVLFLLYKSYQKNKRKPVLIEKESNIFNHLGENEASGAKNEHFIFPEKNLPMKEETLNKFKVANEIENEVKNAQVTDKGKDKKKLHEEPANEIEKLKKDYKGKTKKDRGFVFDAENSILSHEILMKKESKNRHK